MTRWMRTALLAGAVLALVSGCGGGSDSSSAGARGDNSRATAASGPAKAAFIKRADVICEKTDQEQKQGQVSFSEEHPGNATRALEEEAVAKVGLPPVQKEAEEIGNLRTPTGDEAEIEAIVSGLEGAVKKAEAKPAVLLEEGSSGPFSEVFKLARDYGFKACATPL
jgi:hypothetical protein